MIYRLTTSLIKPKTAVFCNVSTGHLNAIIKMKASTHDNTIIVYIYCNRYGELLLLIMVIIMHSNKGYMQTNRHKSELYFYPHVLL